ncbi:uncharacterized protein [Venturia canescens]|uniref:uncharacterized protein n=1 Tax=Venturia canescens TaxID=32260 RepID=UPI001C9C42AE|nr:uncharacterized protein LOC122409823 [Venturia canescens]
MGFSDAYVMESDQVIPYSRINTRIYYQNLQRQQINASIVSILGTRQCQTDNGTSKAFSQINNIYMMRPHTPARLFNLLVGTEPVSAGSVVQNLIKVKRGWRVEPEGNQITDSIKVHPDLEMYYKSQDSFQREQMCWALLLIVVFVNLSIRRNSAILSKAVKDSPP